MMRTGMAADHGRFASKVQLRTLEEKERNKILLSETRWHIEGKERGRSDPWPPPEYLESEDA